jgi:F-type H+-transporting ATPase subunit b
MSNPAHPAASGSDTKPGDAAVAHNLNDAAELQGMPHSGADAVQKEAGGIGHENHPDPSVAGILDATVFVSMAMAVFIVILLWKGVPRLITGGLDRQIAAIRTRLDEAKALRTEAEALRDEYLRKLASVDAELAGLMNQAETESRAILAKAESDAEALVARRGRMAEDKIAAAERAALDEVRARTASAAALAAEQLIRERLDAGADRKLVDQAIQGLGRAH